MKEIIDIEHETILQAFKNKNGLDEIIQKARDLVDNFTHDLSTNASRARSRSLAAKISKLKVKIDDEGKNLVAEWKEKSKAVDETRKFMREELDLLRDEAKRPVVEWEQEQERIAKEAEAEAEKIRLAEKFELDFELAILMNREFDRLLLEEERRIEQDRLRIAEEARLKAMKEAEEYIKNAKIEKENAIKEMKLMAKREEAKRIQAIKDEKLAEINRQKEALILAKQEEAKRIQAIKDEKLAEINRQKEALILAKREEAKRRKDIEHVTKIRTNVKEFLMGLGCEEKLAKIIVLSVSRNENKFINIDY